ncbi:MAG: hypothetical protein CVT64_09355 [Actinobacteria bacterium HGW-Actinobacteria-4]|nr:MAG: hypothetical protein CVT64_09355 [Actinobacteria bacterium HGW-Actinobacteria-4]
MDAAPPPTTPPAAWYPDPTNPAHLRYWNGMSWTEHTAPAGSSQPPPTWPGASQDSVHGPDGAMHWLLPVGRSGESIAAGYMGLACLVLFWTGPVVIVLAAATFWVSIRALKKATTGGHGRGRAITGLVTASIGAVAGLVGTVAMLTGGFF